MYACTNYLSGGSSEYSRNSPGRDRLEPWWGETKIVFRRGSEAKHHQRKLSDPVGASQSSPEISFVRSMKPFNHSIGSLDPRNSKERTNRGWAPQSEVRRAGTPNLETQVEIKARAQVSVVMDDSGTASGHLEVLSIIFSR